MKNFRTLDSAVEFYRLARTLKIGGELKDQLDRAAISVALNISEGNGRRTTKDRVRLFNIAMTSMRECQTALILADFKNTPAWNMLDSVAAQLHQLIKHAR